MLTFPPIPYQRRNRPVRGRRSEPAPPGPALSLVEVIYPADAGLAVQLRFDAAISIGSFNASQIVASDSVRHQLRQGFGGGALIDARTVQVELANVGVYGGTDDLLNASSDNGIVAVEDGTAWAGVAGLVLPFP